MPKKQTGMLLTEQEVLTILNGRKIQTRRPMKPGSGPHTIEQVVCSENALAALIRHQSKFGGVGDLIWGRETFRKGVSDYGLWVVQYKADDQVLHMVATENGEGDIVGVGSLAYSFFPPEIKWTPSLHMPIWASRLWLEIKNVRVERVNAITEQDAIAEGVRAMSVDDLGGTWQTHKRGFESVWVARYGQESWDKGWCWVYDFKRVGRPNEWFTTK